MQDQGHGRSHVLLTETHGKKKGSTARSSLPVTEHRLRAHGGSGSELGDLGPGTTDRALNPGAGFEKDCQPPGIRPGTLDLLTEGHLSLQVQNSKSS